jgi:cellulose biosynthesis protein BcsQ
MKTIAFFNNKGGVGKTSLVYHLAWMFPELGLKILVVDLDPQANLTSMALDPDRLETLMEDQTAPQTVMASLNPFIEGVGDVAPAPLQALSDGIDLIPGDLALSNFEDQLSETWPKCLDGDVRAFRAISAFARMIRVAGETAAADIALIDVGPNLGAINRASLIAADYVVLPLGADLYSLQGIRNLGPRLRAWRKGWQDRLDNKGDIPFWLPAGGMRPAGYIVMRHSIRLDRTVASFARWIARMPRAYADYVLKQPDFIDVAVEQDPHCLAQLRDYRSLMPMAMEAHKPMFLLKPGDGAIGGHQTAVKTCYNDFKALAIRIAAETEIDLPPM